MCVFAPSIRVGPLGAWSPGRLSRFDDCDDNDDDDSKVDGLDEDWLTSFQATTVSTPFVSRDLYQWKARTQPFTLNKPPTEAAPRLPVVEFK